MRMPGRSRTVGTPRSRSTSPGGGKRRAAAGCGVPSRKIADIEAAVRFVSTLSYVHPDRVGYLGVCASAQYVLAAMARGVPITSFAAVAGWFHDSVSVAPFYGGREGVELRLARAQEALDRYLRTGEIVRVPAYDPGNDRAAMFVEMDYYANADRGAVPAWSLRWPS